MPIPCVPLPPLLATILADIRSHDFSAQDDDYAPEHVKEDVQFKTITPDYCNDDGVVWFEGIDDGLSWSFHVHYMTADSSGDPSSDVAVMEIGIAADFRAEDVDSTLIVTLELSEEPYSGNQSTPPTHARVATPSMEAWQRFKAEHLDAAFKQGNAMAEAQRADWSDIETEDEA